MALNSKTTPRLYINAGTCIGCRLCEQWCSWQHTGAVRPSLARIQVRWDSYRDRHFISVCEHCDDPACLEACALEAIRRDPRTGGLVLDADLCTGCQACAAACTNGSLRIDLETGFPLLCDLCGGDPACARHCPDRAVWLGEGA